VGKFVFAFLFYFYDTQISIHITKAPKRSGKNARKMQKF
jgi:hypothetical protein